MKSDLVESGARKMFRWINELVFLMRMFVNVGTLFGRIYSMVNACKCQWSQYKKLVFPFDS